MERQRTSPDEAVKVLESCRDLLEEGAIGFDPVVLSSEGNLVLRHRETGNVALFEHTTGKVYEGHYFFRVGGRVGLEVAKDFLREVFEVADVVTGLTPRHNKKALFFSAKLGFNQIGVVETPLGDMVLQMLTVREFNQ